VLLALAVLVAAVVYLDRSTWIASRRLANALKEARQVVLVEYVEDIQIARKVATPEETSRLRRSITTWPRPFVPTGYLCFVPHHSIEITRADGSTLECDLCFECEKFIFQDDSPIGLLPPYLAGPLTSFFSSVGMSPKTYEEYTEIAVRAHKIAPTPEKNVSD
jgi:hypothetical protein